MLQSNASMTVSELLRPKAQGAQVNVHVQPASREPSPDYEAMRRLVATRESPAVLGHERNSSPAREFCDACVATR